jgi:tetratricopeptide (TPR) repeat protein
VTSSIPRQIVRARPHDPPTDRRLAAIHLRMGQLGLARAELEALAGSGDLDDRTLLVLAEARWRTGDLTGAGEAAQAYLATGGDDIVALVIAAEATSAVGRPTEARRLAGRALERSDVPLDRIFAGQRRSLIWPVDATEAVTPEVMFPRPATETATEFVRPPAIPEVTPEPAPAEELPISSAAVEAAPEPARDGFWDVETIRGEEIPSPRDELATARTDIAAGDLTAAAIHLGIALRIGPDLASDVLDLIEPLASRSPELELIRGDALRLVGREDDARRAYAEASLAIVRRQASPDDSPGVDPAATNSDFEEER